MEFNEWLEYGIEKGFCTPQFCNTHDGYPMHESEVNEWEEGGDPCAFMVRLGTEDDWSLN